MEKLSYLFKVCAFAGNYETVGKDVNYKFVEEKDRLFIYFQGSKNINEKGGIWDWIRNLWFFPRFARPYKEMEVKFKVHGGFLASWNEVKDIIGSKILEKENEEYKWKEIIIVGYSLGAALAGLCHEYCQYWRNDLHEKNLIHGFGFESPRFLHKYKVPENLKDRWRNFLVIRNHSDIVTHCPPWILCFCHVGEMLKLTDEIKHVGFPKFICYHLPDNVLNALVAYEENL